MCLTGQPCYLGQRLRFSGLVGFFAFSKGYSKLEHIQAGGLHLAREGLNALMSLASAEATRPL